jgi:hypothetical protein
LTFRLLECIIVKENRKTSCDNRGDNNSLSDALDTFLRENRKAKGLAISLRFGGNKDDRIWNHRQALGVFFVAVL